MHERTETILKRSLSVAAVVILLAGCQSVRVNDLPYPHIRGMAEINIDQATKNVNILTDKNSDYCYPKEREYYPSCPSNTAQNIRPATELALSGGGMQTVQSNTPQYSRPQIGLALSGGGMRSAAFSIGVMSGLANYPGHNPDKSINHMKSIDIMSAVSGGSYALSWYYLQQYYMMQAWSRQKDSETDKNCEKLYDDENKYNKCLEKVCEKYSGECDALLAKLRKDLLYPDGPFQVHLKNNGDLLGKMRGGIWTLFDIVAIPIHLISNAVFGWQTNTSISRELYEKRIEQVFHSIPDNVHVNTTNGYTVSPDVGSNWLTTGIEGKSANFHDLSGFIKNQKLPFFIVNATLQLDDDPWHRGAKFSNSVFEFTPLHLGSSGVGYATWNDSINDANQLKCPTSMNEGKEKICSSKINNIKKKREECLKIVKKKREETCLTQTECPPYIQEEEDQCHTEAKNKNDEECCFAKLPEALPMSVARGVSISGAAIDSFATVPGTQQKLFVAFFNNDLGYYMPNYNCPPSCKDVELHNALPIPFYFLVYHARDRHGVKLYLSDGGHMENLGAFSLVSRLPERIIIVDAEQDYDEENFNKQGKGYVFEAYRKLKAGLKAEMGVNFTVCELEEKLMKEKESVEKNPICIEEKKSRRDSGSTEKPIDKIGPYNTEKSCLDGKIEYFPYPDAPSGLAVIDVKYIKLSIDSKHLSIYPDSVKNYFNKTTNGKKEGFYCDWLGGCPFPQQSTTEQSYSDEQFKAYRDLGQWIVKNQCDLNNWIPSEQQTVQASVRSPAVE